MTSLDNSNDLSSFLDLVPKQIMNKDTALLLKKYTEALNDIFFLDSFGELSADREALIKLTNYIPSKDSDLLKMAVLETAKHAGRRLKTKGKGLALKWQEVARYGPAISPVSPTELTNMGITKSATVTDIQTALASKLTGLDASWSELSDSQLQEMLLTNMRKNRSWWDCVVAMLGWWAALMVIGFLGVILIIAAGIATGGVAWVALWIWIVGVVGFGTAVIMLNCAINPG